MPGLRASAYEFVGNAILPRRNVGARMQDISDSVGRHLLT